MLVLKDRENVHNTFRNFHNEVGRMKYVTNLHAGSEHVANSTSSETGCYPDDQVGAWLLCLGQFFPPKRDLRNLPYSGFNVVFKF